MNGNLKALGMALAAVFAIGAVSASAASASTIDHTFLAHGQFGTAVQDPEEPAQVFEFTTGGAKLSCKEFTASGEAVENKETEMGVEEFETEGTKIYRATAATVHPVYNKGEKTCTTNVIGKAQIKTEGCNYLFTTTTTSEGKHATVHLECEAGHEIEFVASGCTLHIPPQTLEGIHYKTDPAEGTGTTEKALTVEATIEDEIHYTSTGSLCGLAGIPKEGTEGSEFANTTWTAYRDKEHKERVGLWTEEMVTP